MKSDAATTSENSVCVADNNPSTFTIPTSEKLEAVCDKPGVSSTCNLKNPLPDESLTHEDGRLNDENSNNSVHSGYKYYGALSHHQKEDELSHDSQGNNNQASSPESGNSRSSLSESDDSADNLTFTNARGSTFNKPDNTNNNNYTYEDVSKSNNSQDITILNSNHSTEPETLTDSHQSRRSENASEKNDNIGGSENRRKASSRKSQAVRKVVPEELEMESDYYDSDLEEYMTPIVAKPITEPAQKAKDRRTSKRKRKIVRHVEPDNDYFYIESFLTNIPVDEVSHGKVTPKKKRKTKTENDNTEKPTDLEQENAALEPAGSKPSFKSVKLHLPNGMTRVVSLSMPELENKTSHVLKRSESELQEKESNSMLCSLLTGKRFLSPIQTAKPKRTHTPSSADPKVKKVRFSEMDADNLVPETVVIHDVKDSSDSSDGEDGNVPLILENLLTNNDSESRHSTDTGKCDNIPAFLDGDQILDLSLHTFDPSSSKHTKVNESLLKPATFNPSQTMHPARASSSKATNLNKASFKKITVNASDKGFSKTLMNYLTDGVVTPEQAGVKNKAQGMDSNLPETDEVFSIKPSSPRGKINTVPNPKTGVPVSAPENTTKTFTTSLLKAKLTRSNAASEYIDLNDLYAIQQGKRPAFELAEKDIENYVNKKDSKVIKSGPTVSKSRQNVPKSVSQFIPIVPDLSKVMRAKPVTAMSLKKSTETSSLKSVANGTHVTHAESTPHRQSQKNAALKPQIKINSHVNSAANEALICSDQDLIKSISFTVTKLAPSSPAKEMSSQRVNSNHQSQVTNSLVNRSLLTNFNRKNTSSSPATGLKIPHTPITVANTSGNVKPKGQVYNSLLTGNVYVMKKPPPTVLLTPEITKPKV